MTEPTHFSLFSGIGGIDIAAEWAGFKTVGQVEKAEYPYKILCKHFPEVPKWRDVRDVTIESVRREGIKHITVLSGGFPCQPFSFAGKRRGKEDPRFLWKEMLRLVSELKPTWILGENVAGIISMELDNCITDLESQDYSYRPFLLPACAINAPHRRDRVFIVAHSRHNARSTEQELQPEISKELIASSTGQLYPKNVTNSTSKRKTRYLKKCRENREQLIMRQGTSTQWYASEPGMGRVVDGVPKRMDRLKCLGNAVVPYQIYPILKSIAITERMYNT